ncbi:protein OCTOPUS-like [Pyrus x bretschneideri]|uniref:protein OCTOPUS-like n=1 Tax=Pyrus x bretschneideri TaxID=225117 RepID=UPI00202FADBA|nr:protein OCTOPUS-like [Pyrus x bretschneideri]
MEFRTAKDCYNSQRRRSFERPSFDRSATAEVDELKLGSNARVSPATSELFYGAKLLITEKELMSSMGSNSKLKSAEDDERAEESSGVEIVSGHVCKNAASESTNGVDVDRQKSNRRHKKWSFWGLMQRRSEKKCVDEGSADSWQKLRRVANGEEANASVSQKLIRSYSVSCRNQCKMVGLLSNVNGVGAETKSNEVKTLQRNKSARYSPSNLDHGLLRFYLTPLRSYRRSESGKSRPGNNSQYLSKNVL